MRNPNAPIGPQKQGKTKSKKKTEEINKEKENVDVEARLTRKKKGRKELMEAKVDNKE